jgi:hypothetical protein
MADAEAKRPNRPGENFVSKIVQDPANPPDLVRMTGYRGAAAEKEHIRLYANPELSVYWDIPEADVLYEQAVSPETDPLGAVTLWVKRDSKIIPSKGMKGAEQAMHTSTPYCYPGTGGGFAAAPQGQAHILTPTLTIHNSITPICHSIYLAYCPPSPLPFYCHSPLPYCVPSPHAPYCVPHVSPACPTQPTTFGTYVPYGQQAQAQPEFGAGYGGAAAPQGFTATFTPAPSQILPCTFSPIPLHCTIPPPSPIPVHCTISPIPIHCTIPPSPIPLHCTIPPSPIQLHCTIPLSPQPVHCTIPLSPLVVQCTHPSPSPYCVVSPACTVVASPNCPNTQPTTFPTTQPTTVTTIETGPATGFAAQAAAPQQAFHLRPTLTATAFPSEILYQCTHVTPGTHVTPASPYCTYPTVTYTYPTYTPRTYGGGGYGGY